MTKIMMCGGGGEFAETLSPPGVWAVALPLPLPLPLPLRQRLPLPVMLPLRGQTGESWA